MNTEKYNRTVTLHCPTCGSSNFSQLDEAELEAALVTCASCGREITKAELIRENTENIDEHVKEIKVQVVEDLQHQLKQSLVDAFKDNEYIKIK